jgi:hypothetical protein
MSEPICSLSVEFQARRIFCHKPNHKIDDVASVLHRTGEELQQALWYIPNLDYHSIREFGQKRLAAMAPIDARLIGFLVDAPASQILERDAAHSVALAERRRRNIERLYARNCERRFVGKKAIDSRSELAAAQYGGLDTPVT